MSTLPFFKRILVVALLTTTIFLISNITHSQNENPPRSIQADDASQLGVLTILQAPNTIAEKAFSPQNTAFITGTTEGQFCIWNVSRPEQAPGALRLCLPFYIPSVSQYAWSADETQLAINLDTAQQVEIFDVSSPIPVEDWETLEPIITLPPEATAIFSMQFVGKGNQTNLLVRDLFNILKIYRLRDQKVLATYEVVEMQVSSDGRLLAALSYDDELWIIDTHTGKIRFQLSPNRINNAYNFLFSPDSQWLVTWGDDVRVWNMRGDDLILPSRRFEAIPDHVQITPDSRFIATIEGEDIRLWSIETGQPTGMMSEHQGGVGLLAFGGDSRRAISSNILGYGRFWEITEDGVPRLIWWYQGEIDDVFVSPDTNTLLSIRQDFPLRFWNFRTGQIRGQYDLPPQIVISPDWTLIAASYNDIVVWHGLRDDPRQFDRMPTGTSARLVNVRPSPSQDLPRFAVLTVGSPIFVLGKSSDESWLYIQLADGQRGWIQLVDITPQPSLDDLDIIEPREQG